MGSSQTSETSACSTENGVILPTDFWNLVLKHLGFVDIFNFGSVNRTLHQLVREFPISVKVTSRQIAKKTSLFAGYHLRRLIIAESLDEIINIRIEEDCYAKILEISGRRIYNLDFVKKFPNLREFHIRLNPQYTNFKTFLDLELLPLANLRNLVLSNIQ
eukprot:TRINITY_DN4269_c0_g1_i4.p1 TRINITY_DN4269_c0_g1~~TRINITY_DN4269_c0_g1_i4.p1  ORF type:complete len:160 (-),score=15.64 TRINITY_DN4269_c0_g1_i4:726-1205(-)